MTVSLYKKKGGWCIVPVYCKLENEKKQLEIHKALSSSPCLLSSSMFKMTSNFFPSFLPSYQPTPNQTVQPLLLHVIFPFHTQIPISSLRTPPPTGITIPPIPLVLSLPPSTIIPSISVQANTACSGDFHVSFGLDTEYWMTPLSKIG